MSSGRPPPVEWSVLTFWVGYMLLIGAVAWACARC